MSATAVGGLVYREFRESDLPGVLRLWAEHSGWGELTPEKWRAWYQDVPDDPSLVMVAADADDEVVGQAVFTPTTLRVGGREVRSLRLSAPVLRRDLRFGDAEGHLPIVRLCLAGGQLAAERGYQVVYAHTQLRWLPLFRGAERFGLPRFADAVYGCVETPLDGAPKSPGEARRGGLARVAQVASYDARFTKLWAEARESFPIECGVVRSPECVRYKNRGHLTLETSDAGGRLVGYAAVNRRTGLLVDALARTPAELPDVLGATIAWLA